MSSSILTTHTTHTHAQTHTHTQTPRQRRWQWRWIKARHTTLTSHRPSFAADCPPRVSWPCACGPPCVSGQTACAAVPPLRAPSRPPSDAAPCWWPPALHYASTSCCSASSAVRRKKTIWGRGGDVVVVIVVAGAAAVVIAVVALVVVVLVVVVVVLVLVAALVVALLELWEHTGRQVWISTRTHRNPLTMDSTQQWGTADTEIKIPSVEYTELKGSPSKAWSRSVNSYICYTYCKDFSLA